jgi:hypothetical protein
MAAKRPSLAPAAQLASKPVMAAIIRQQSTDADIDIAKRKLKATPETVSSTSTVHPVFGEVGNPTADNDVDMMAGIRSDFVSFVDFTLFIDGG